MRTLCRGSRCLPMCRLCSKVRAAASRDSHHGAPIVNIPKLCCEASPATASPTPHRLTTMPTSLNFELHTGPGGQRAPEARRSAGAPPVRLLLLGDFGGRSQARPAQAAPAPAAVRWPATPRAVDIDNLDAVMALMAPKLQLQIQNACCDFAPQSLDDFHPDQLLQNLPPLQQGLARLQALQDPQQFAAAAAAWDTLQGHNSQAPATAKVTVSGTASASASASPSATAPASAAGDLLSSLLGGRVQVAAGTQASPKPTVPPTGIDALLRSAVAGQVVPAAPAQQSAYVAAAQAALADDLRSVLHHPAFAALESTWRAVQLLVSRLHLGEKLELHLADATLPDLLADLVAAQGQVQATALYGLFAGQGRDGSGSPDTQRGARWQAVFGLFEYGDNAVDLALLAAAGSAAAQTQVPFVAGVTQELKQVALATSGNARAAAQTGWQTLRRSEVAPWLGLVSSPLLLRLPYGRRLEPVQSFVFEELLDAAAPTHLLWGTGASAAAALFGQSCSDAGAGSHTLDDLPALVLRNAADEDQLQACGGRYLSDAETEALLGAGLMPLISHRRKSAVLLPRWQSVAEPLQTLRGLPKG